MSDPVRGFFNWAMLVLGALIVALAGPCTVFYAGGAVAEIFIGGGNVDLGLVGFIIVTALIVGGIPLAGGVALLVIGFKTLRADRRRPPG